MAKIKDLNALEKPREKAERFGLENLKDEDLLAIIINNGTVGHSSLEIAKDIMNEAHCFVHLLQQPYQYFQCFKGINKALAIRLGAAMEIAKRIREKQQIIYEQDIVISSQSLYQKYQLKLSSLNQEVLLMIILNKNKTIINETELYKGDSNNIPFSHRDILRLLILYNGSYFYLIHNHPQGSLSPSDSDIILTRKIKEKASHIGVKLIDHLIISSRGYYSFCDERCYLKK